MKNILSITFYLLLLLQICCGQMPVPPKPLKELVNDKIIATKLTRFLTEKQWDQLFPNRFGIGHKDTLANNRDFYSYIIFVQAAKIFPSFLADNNDTIQKRELSAFLANIAQETSGGWDDAPGGYFRWGMYFLEENNNGIKNRYNDTSKKKNIRALKENIIMAEAPNN